jgi:hypothetical protein
MEVVVVAEAKDHDATASHPLKETINMTLESGSTLTGRSMSDLVGLEPRFGRKQSRKVLVSAYPAA